MEKCIINLDNGKSVEFFLECERKDQYLVAQVTFVTGERYKVTICTPESITSRLFEANNQGIPCIAEHSICTIPELTSDNIHVAIADLWSEGHFSRCLPLGDPPLFPKWRILFT